MSELDAHIHQPTRLRIMMLLSGVETADFNFVRSALGLSNGNLSAHTSRLEEAGYVKVSKTFVGKMPVTSYRLTKSGRARLAEYWAAIDAIRGLGAAPPEGKALAQRARRNGESAEDNKTLTTTAQRAQRKSRPGLT